MKVDKFLGHYVAHFHYLLCLFAYMHAFIDMFIALGGLTQCCTELSLSCYPYFSNFNVTAVNI